MDWLVQLDLSAEVRENFLNYLYNLYLQNGPQRHFQRERLWLIHIPVVANGGQIPESMNFAQLAENLCSNIARVRIELMRYYNDFRSDRRANTAAVIRPPCVVLSTAQLASSRGLSPRQVRDLACKNQIQGTLALKQGRRWRFFQTA